MYPVTPNRAETRGRTEEYIGSWLAKTGRRDAFILASKVSGPVPAGVNRGDNKHLTRANIENALNNSLRRLNTDYLDLYQVHWPDRPSPAFGKRGLQKLSDKPETVPIEETLEALDALVKAGKIRAFGVSNETPWGVAEYLRLSREKGLARVASIQNAYNLLNRLFETGLSEFSLREGVGLLAYSPLASGHLTGKYLGGVVPPGSRLDVANQFARYDVTQQPDASARYVAIAHAFGLSPAALALAYVYRQPFVTSSIIGATSVQQLEDDIAGSLVDLPKEALAAVEAVHRAYPDPCP